MIEGKWIWRVLEGSIKGDISLKGGLCGVAGRPLSTAVGYVFSMTCPSLCITSLV